MGGGGVRQPGMDPGIGRLRTIQFGQEGTCFGQLVPSKEAAAFGHSRHSEGGATEEPRR